MGAAPASPASVVSAFIATVESFDLEGALAFLADDVEYDNVPMGKMHGIDQVRAGLGPFVGRFDEIDWPVSRMSSSGTVEEGTVFTERVDRFRAGDTWLELPVCGVFEVRDGRITLWRDYFDLATFTNAVSSLS